MPSSRKNKWALIVLGTVVWASTMVKSGLVYPFGLGFWGPNGHDGIWHIALINSLSQGNFQIPIFSGSPIQNYHIGFDVLIALITRLTTLPVLNLYFQVLPPTLAFLIGYLTYSLVYVWKKNTTAAWWATFFVYFGGSMGWLLGQGESLFWAQQSLSTLINPPFALSLVLLLAGLYCLHRDSPLGAVIIFGLLSQVKIYASVLVLICLGILSLFDKKYLKVLIGSSFLSALLFFPLNRNSQNLLLWQPGWFLETLFAPDRLNFPRFFSALNTYRVGQIWYKAIPAYSLALLVFIIGNLSTRLIVLFPIYDWIRQPRKPHALTVFFIGLFLSGLICPMLFLQTGTSWNTIQFFYYSQTAVSILAGLTVANLVNKYKQKLTRMLLVGSIITLTIPSTLQTLQNYLPSRPPAKLSFDELESLRFLSQLPAGIVLTVPYDKDLSDSAIPFPPRPLYLYESTAYVSAFSRHTVFLEDQVNLNITGYNWTGRRQEIIAYFKHPQAEFLKKNQISYVYLVDKQQILATKISGIKKVFSNSSSSVYEVSP